MRQHLAGRLLVADEIVVDEIDRGGMPALAPHGIELGGDLLRGFQPRLAAVEPRDVAELAAVRAAAGELHRAHQVALERDQVIGRDRELGERQPLLGLEHDLRGRRLDARIEPRHQRIGAVAELAHMQVVDLRIHLRRRRGRGPAQHRDLAGRLGAGMDVAHLRGLDVHGRDHDGIRPAELGRGRRPDVLVDEAHFPGRRHIGRDQQQPLRRHERPHPAHQPVGMVEGAERRGVARKHAQNPALVPYLNRRPHLSPRYLSIPPHARLAGRARQELSGFAQV